MNSIDRMIRSAERHLEGSCPHMRKLIPAFGPCTLRTQPDGFRMLVRSITSQQISGFAARAILGRLLDRIAPMPLRAEAVRRCGEKGLRGVGYSQRKASYVVGLATEVLERGLDLEALRDVSDEEVVEKLTQVRGIGEWTAHMFLIFSLGRPDILPHGDLGVRQALRELHALPALPGKREAIELARPWRPFASVASWYCWRSIDAKPPQERA